MLNKVLSRMITYYSGDPKRIQHFIKVHSFCEYIAVCEGLDEKMLEILQVTAYTHDIGIKVGEQKYGVCTGKIQEEEGPIVARAMLLDIGYDTKIIDRVCYLIGHHHTYDNIDSIDYQILVEADFLVNIFESSMPLENILSVRKNIFKTASGINILNEMFALE